jgi:hypothetical protein
MKLRFYEGNHLKRWMRRDENIKKFQVKYDESSKILEGVEA